MEEKYALKEFNGEDIVIKIEVDKPIISISSNQENLNEENFLDIRQIISILYYDLLSEVYVDNVDYSDLEINENSIMIGKKFICNKKEDSFYVDVTTDIVLTVKEYQKIARYLLDTKNLDMKITYSNYKKRNNKSWI